jgi:hypothetical protein
MSDVLRLIDGDADDWECRVLRSALVDAPDPLVKERVMLAVAGTAATVAAGASTAAVMGAQATASASVKGAVSTALLMKWLGGGFVAGVIAASSVRVLTPPEKPESAVASGSAIVNAAERPHRQDVVRLRPPEPISASVPVSLPSPSKALAARPAPSTRAFEAARVKLSDELASLDRARAKLSSGDAGGALSLLDVHQKEYAGGTLAPEAEVLRIRALLGAGNAAAAAARADAFLSANPQSPHAARVATLLERARSVEK